MSNYSPIVTYGPKDSLAHGDPNKAIKGSQMDAELNAIATAISTKLDSSLTNVTITGAANQYGLTVQGSATSGQSFGVRVAGGSTSADTSFVAQNSAGSNLFRVRGDGEMFAGSVDFTPLSGTFSVTASGALTGTLNLNYFKLGPVAWIWTNTAYTTAASAGGIISLTSLPAILRPSIQIAGTQCQVWAGGTLPNPLEGYFILPTNGIAQVIPLGGAFASNAGFNIGVIMTYVVQ